MFYMTIYNTKLLLVSRGNSVSDVETCLKSDVGIYCIPRLTENLLSST